MSITQQEVAALLRCWDDAFRLWRNDEGYGDIWEMETRRLENSKARLEIDLWAGGESRLHAIRCVCAFCQEKGSRRLAEAVEGVVCRLAEHEPVTLIGGEGSGWRAYLEEY